MAWADMPSFNLTLLCTALTAAVLAGALLALEFFGSPRLARRTPGVFAAALALGAITAWSFKGMGWIALGSATLAGVLLIAWPMSFDGARHWMMRLLTPKVAWATVLGVSMIASRYLAAHVLSALDRQPPPQSV